MTEERAKRLDFLRSQYKGKSLQDLAKRMVVLRDEKDKIDEELSLVNEDLDLIRFELIPQLMDDEGVERVRYDEIGTLYIRSGLRASLNGQRRQDAIQWLDDHGHGDLVKPTVNAQSLAAAIAAMIRKGTEVPPELINVHPFSQAVITK